MQIKVELTEEHIGFRDGTMFTCPMARALDDAIGGTVPPKPYVTLYDKLTAGVTLSWIEFWYSGKLLHRIRTPSLVTQWVMEYDHGRVVGTPAGEPVDFVIALPEEMRSVLEEVFAADWIASNVG